MPKSAVFFIWVIAVEYYKRIRVLREENDLTQQEAGKSIGLSQRTYAYYEAGKRVVPPSVLHDLADFYKVSVDYIMGRTDERAPYPKAKK